MRGRVPTRTADHGHPVRHSDRDGGHRVQPGPGSPPRLDPARHRPHRDPVRSRRPAHTTGRHHRTNPHRGTETTETTGIGQQPAAHPVPSGTHSRPANGNLPAGTGRLPGAALLGAGQPEKPRRPLPDRHRRPAPRDHQPRRVHSGPEDAGLPAVPEPSGGLRRRRHRGPRRHRPPRRRHPAPPGRDAAGTGSGTGHGAQPRPAGVPHPARRRTPQPHPRHSRPLPGGYPRRGAPARGRPAHRHRPRPDHRPGRHGRFLQLATRPRPPTRPPLAHRHRPAQPNRQPRPRGHRHAAPRGSRTER